MIIIPFNFALQVIGIELRDPVNKATVPVTNLAKPLKLTFTVTQAPDGKQLGCVFFDTNRKIWVKEGLIAVEAGNNSLICESLHLTFFAPSNDAKNTSTTAPSTTPAVGGKNALYLNSCCMYILGDSAVPRTKQSNSSVRTPRNYGHFPTVEPPLRVHPREKKKCPLDRGVPYDILVNRYNILIYEL